MFRLLRSLAFAACLAAVARAEGPDDQFIVVYNLIQQADKSADTAESRRLYLSAQDGLRQLQRGYPRWNERVVTYRLRYVADKLAALPAPPASPSPASREVGTPATAATPESSPPGEVLTQFNELNSRIRQLAEEKQLLEARLREALSAQPAPVDPRELQAAVERISSLQSTNKVLLTRLETQERERRNLVDRVVAEEAQRALQETRRQLEQQQQASARLERERADIETRLQKLQSDQLKPLRQENQALKQQVTELRNDTERGRQVADLAAKLGRLQSDLEEVRRQNTNLVSAKAALERQVNDLQAKAAEEGVVRIAKLETELAVARADAARNALRTEELEGALQQERASREKLEQQGQALANRVTQLTARTEADTATVITLQSALAEERAERTALEAALKAAEERLTLLASTPASSPPGAPTSPSTPPAPDPRLDSLTAEVSELKAALREGTRRESELQAALNQEASLRRRVADEKAELERRVATLSRPAAAASKPAPAEAAGSPAGPAPLEPAALEARVRQLEQERSDLQARLQALSRESLERRRSRGFLRFFTSREHAAGYRRPVPASATLPQKSQPSSRDAGPATGPAPAK